MRPQDSTPPPAALAMAIDPAAFGKPPALLWERRLSDDFWAGPAAAPGVLRDFSYLLQLVRDRRTGRPYWLDALFFRVPWQALAGQPEGFLYLLPGPPGARQSRRFEVAGVACAEYTPADGMLRCLDGFTWAAGALQARLLRIGRVDRHPVRLNQIEWYRDGTCLDVPAPLTDLSPHEAAEELAMLRLLLGEGARRGRPPGSGHWASDDEFKAAAVRTIQDLASHRRKVTEANVAAYLCDRYGKGQGDERQLRKWLEDAGLTWPELVREALTRP